MLENVQQVENRIAQIQARIQEITGQDASTGVTGTQTSFQTALSSASRPAGTKSTQWDSLIQQAATTNGVDAGLLKAVMLSESGGNPSARSAAGAMGLMQLMPATAKSLGVTDPYDPEQSINAGARYLRGLIDRMGSPELAVAAYNAGAGAVRRYGGIPPYPETQNYVATVMSRWQEANR